MATMGGGSHRIPFKIFDTDYTSYEIMYHCENIDKISKTESFAVSSRTPQVTKEFFEKVNKVIKQKIPQYDLYSTDATLYYDVQNSFCKYEWKY